MPNYEAVSTGPQLPTSIGKNRKAPEKLVPTTVSLPASVHQELRIACAVHGIKIQDAAAEAFREWLKEHPPIPIDNSRGAPPS